MKYFGRVKAFDSILGHGSLEQETGGSDLNFERGALAWDSKKTPPTAGQRLSYDVGSNSNRQPCAINIQTI